MTARATTSSTDRRLLYRPRRGAGRVVSAARPGLPPPSASSNSPNILINKNGVVSGRGPRRRGRLESERGAVTVAVDAAARAQVAAPAAPLAAAAPIARRTTGRGRQLCQGRLDVPSELGALGGVRAPHGERAGSGLAPALLVGYRQPDAAY